MSWYVMEVRTLKPRSEVGIGLKEPRIAMQLRSLLGMQVARNNEVCFCATSLILHVSERKTGIDCKSLSP